MAEPAVPVSGAVAGGARLIGTSGGRITPRFFDGGGIGSASEGGVETSRAGLSPVVRVDAQPTAAKKIRTTPKQRIVGGPDRQSRVGYGERNGPLRWWSIRCRRRWDGASGRREERPTRTGRRDRCQPSPWEGSEAPGPSRWS